MYINNTEVNFSITDVNHAEAFEKALQKMEATEKAIKEQLTAKKITYIEFMRQGISMLKSFFVDATGVDVIGECTDYMVAQEHYFAFLGEIGKAKDRLVAPYSADRVR